MENNIISKFNEITLAMNQLPSLSLQLTVLSRKHLFFCKYDMLLKTCLKVCLAKSKYNASAITKTDIKQQIEKTLNILSTMFVIKILPTVSLF